MQFRVLATTASVTLAWNPSADPTITGYNIYYGGASYNYTNEISVGDATNVTISGLIPGTTYYFAATTYSASGMESEFSSQLAFLVPTIVNQAPTLNTITNLTIKENAGLQTVSFSDVTSGSLAENQTLVVTATSSNTGLIPNPTVNYTNGFTTGKLTFTPATNGNGTATITVAVNDGGTSNNIVTRTFTVTVNAVNQAPTLNAISNLAITKNAGMQMVNLSGITSGAANENQVLTVTAVSSSTGLIPNPTVNYTSPNTTGSLTFTPGVNKTGTATVTVTVKDGGTSNNIVTRTFTVTVAATTTASSRGQISLARPLTNCVVMAGQTKILSVTATGSGALKYQWKLNGTNLASATRSSLTLSKVTTNQAGIYSVTVSSSTSSTNSAAKLIVYTTPTATLASTAHVSGQYALTVAGVAGFKYAVQASIDMVNWVSLQTNTAPFTFVDTNASQFDQRFYRSVYVP